MWSPSWHLEAQGIVQAAHDGHLLALCVQEHVKCTDSLLAILFAGDRWLAVGCRRHPGRVALTCCLHRPHRDRVGVTGLAFVPQPRGTRRNERLRGCGCAGFLTSIASAAWCTPRARCLVSSCLSPLSGSALAAALATPAPAVPRRWWRVLLRAQGSVEVSSAVLQVCRLKSLGCARGSISNHERVSNHASVDYSEQRHGAVGSVCVWGGGITRSVRRAAAWWCCCAVP